MHKDLHKEEKAKEEKKDTTEDQTTKLPPALQQLAQTFMDAYGITPEVVQSFKMLPQAVANNAKRLGELEDNLTTINNLVAQGMEYASKAGIDVNAIISPNAQGQQGNPNPAQKGGLNPKGLTGALEFLKTLKNMRGQEPSTAQKLMNRLLESTVNNTIAMQNQRIDINQGTINLLEKAGLLDKAKMASNQPPQTTPRTEG